MNIISIPKKQNALPIIFSANNYYVPYTSAMIQSIMENSIENTRYVFYIMHQDISENNQNLLKQQVSLYPWYDIEFISVTQYISDYELFVSRHITIETYFRLLIPFLFSEYKNVLYLDGDMICLSDISNLFNLNLENFMLAAVWDTDVSRYYCPKDKKIILKRHSVLPYLKNPAAYFNAGLIVFNTQFFCNSLSFEKILEVTLSRKWKVHDQDILNYLAEDKVLLLPYNWNLMSCPRYDYLPSQQKNEFNDACKNPKIVHFKPWKKDIYIPFSHYFWKYAARTPFVEIITERMELEGFINNESLVERVISRFAKRGGIINKMLKFIFEDLIKNWILNSRYK